MIGLVLKHWPRPFKNNLTVYMKMCNFYKHKLKTFLIFSYQRIDSMLVKIIVEDFRYNDKGVL